jgi:hypothetical protein
MDYFFKFKPKKAANIQYLNIMNEINEMRKANLHNFKQIFHQIEKLQDLKEQKKSTRRSERNEDKAQKQFTTMIEAVVKPFKTAAEVKESIPKWIADKKQYDLDINNREIKRILDDLESVFRGAILCDKNYAFINTVNIDDAGKELLKEEIKKLGYKIIEDPVSFGVTYINKDDIYLELP